MATKRAAGGGKARGFDAELAALEALRGASAEEAQPRLVEALRLKNNFLVAKAAGLAQHHALPALTPELLAAFPRFFEGGSEVDPQCWAKNAIAKALAAFEYQEPEPFLQGMRHRQMEAVWGGQEDTAGTLRGVCALALVQCRGLSSHRVLLLLTPLFADKQLSVRVNVARAVEQVGTDSAALLLRLRAELASDEAELLGACYSGVLGVEGASATAWVAQFLPPEDDAAAEAAMAIAQTHTAEAVAVLQAAYRRVRDPWFRTALLTAIALTRHAEATDWLLNLVARDEQARDAQDALCRAAPSAETLARLRELGRPCP